MSEGGAMSASESLGAPTERYGGEAGAHAGMAAINPIINSATLQLPSDGTSSDNPHGQYSSSQHDTPSSTTTASYRGGPIVAQTAYEVASRQVFNQPVKGVVRCCPFGKTNGNTITFYQTSPEAKLFPQICLLGPDWPCMLVTYTLLLAPSLAFLIFVAPSLHPAVVAVGAVACFAAVGAFSVTACSNPGYLPKQTADQMESQRLRMEEEGVVGQFTICQYCNVIRVEKTTHCYDCNACVVELDHHCPWTGKCIGKYNLFWFYAFLTTMMLLIVYTAACMFAWIVQKATGAQA